MNAEHNEVQFRSAVYELLSLAFLYPDRGTVALLRRGAEELTAWASDEVGEIEDALQELVRELDKAGGQLEADYEDVFGHTVSSDCPPYEGEYGQAHVFQKSQTLADLSGFYGSWGVRVSPDLHDRIDHVSVEMEFMHLLALKEAHALANGHGKDKVLLCHQAQEAFVLNHLANWIDAFGERLARKAAISPVYASAARLLQMHMRAEFARFGADSTPMQLSQQEDGPGDDRSCAAVEALELLPQEAMTP